MFLTHFNWCRSPFLKCPREIYRRSTILSVTILLLRTTVSSNLANVRPPRTHENKYQWNIISKADSTSQVCVCVLRQGKLLLFRVSAIWVAAWVVMQTPRFAQQVVAVRKLDQQWQIICSAASTPVVFNFCFFFLQRNRRRILHGRNEKSFHFLHNYNTWGIYDLSTWDYPGRHLSSCSQRLYLTMQTNRLKQPL